MKQEYTQAEKEAPTSSRKVLFLYKCSKFAKLKFLCLPQQNITKNKQHQQQTDQKKTNDLGINFQFFNSGLTSSFES